MGFEIDSPKKEGNFVEPNSHKDSSDTAFWELIAGFSPELLMRMMFFILLFEGFEGRSSFSSGEFMCGKDFLKNKVEK